MSRISRSLSLKHSFDQYHGKDYGFSAGDYILLGDVKIRTSFKNYEVHFPLRQHEIVFVFVFLLSLLRPSIRRYLIFIVISYMLEWCS